MLQKLFWPFTVRMNYSIDIKRCSQSLHRFFFLTVGLNNFGNKILILHIIKGQIHKWQVKIFPISLVVCWNNCSDLLWQKYFMLKVSKSRKQIMASSILPKNERNSLRILSWVCFVRFLEESRTSQFALVLRFTDL